jgi:hypothetical protein
MLMNYDSTNIRGKIERRSVDKEFIVDTANKTTIYNEKKLLRTELEGLIQYIREVDFNLMKNDSRDTIIDKIARNFSNQLGARGGTVIDTHELMKMNIEMNKNGENIRMDTDCAPYGSKYGIRDPSLLYSSNSSGQNGSYNGNNMREGFGNTKALNTDETNAIYEENINGGIIPKGVRQKIQNLYLLLDSKYRNLSTENNVFKWTVLHSANTTQGTVNTLCDQIHNIMNIQFDRFTIPYVASADNVYKKISVYIEEFSSMAILINSGRRYHMIFNSEIAGNQIQLTPLINDEGRFRFHTPINILDSITLKFHSPFSPVVFLPDRYNVVITSISLTESILTFSIPHQVADGELVHLEDYNTLNPGLDSIQINEVNKEVGHIVTFINNTVLRINVGLTTVTPDSTNLTLCFIASRRLIIPIRMEYVV